MSRDIAAAEVRRMMKWSITPDVCPSLALQPSVIQK